MSHEALARSPLAPATAPELPPLEGVRVLTASTGMKYRGRPDLLLLGLPEGTIAAGTFTQSSTRAAPVIHCLTTLAADPSARAVVVNAGNANAFTGAPGWATVREAQAAAAVILAVPPEQVLTASTGVIGEPIASGRLAEAMQGLADSDWATAAEAIRTTDTFAKSARVEVDGVTVQGIAKGSGMIAPDMATMLAFIVTDAAVPAADLQAMTSAAVDQSFNACTVDGDTSTNDTVLVFATGAKPLAAETLAAALTQVMRQLAELIVRDGEGATKLVRVQVTGATDEAAARRIGRAIANSPLVKTAIAGGDANWGRIVMAVGKSGETIAPTHLSIAIGGVALARHGAAVPAPDTAAVDAHMQGEEITLAVDVGVGAGAAEVLTCDLTHGYIAINADYRS